MDTTDLLENKDQLLNDIRGLQEKEKEYYEKLNVPQITDEDKEHILSKIDQIYKMRIYMYNILKNGYSMYEQNTEKTAQLLDDQIVALEIVEKELDNTKKQMEDIKEKKVNTIRKTQINTYYGERYAAHSRLLITFILTGLCLLPLFFLRNKQLIPLNIANILISVIIFIGVIICIYQLIDMYNRSNMNYNQYNWYFNKNKAPTPSSKSIAESVATITPWSEEVTATPSCVGAACCYEGSAYDVILNKCVPNA
jgi:hypothetical protein